MGPVTNVRSSNSNTVLATQATTDIPPPGEIPTDQAMIVADTTTPSATTKGVREKNPDEAAPEADFNQAKYPHGWRLWILTAAMWLSLFLSTLETTIVSTSLVSITNALDGFLYRDWVVTAYLLTYTGFLTIYAKFSDIFGRKTMLLFALVTFTLFSGLCAAANNIVQLIILRAFQGLGASGIYSMIIVIAPELVPPGKFAKYMAIVSTVFIVASVLGPVLGGVINSHSTWRWVFLLNVPGGGVSFILLAAFLPASEASSSLNTAQVIRSKVRRSAWARLDVLGMALLLASSVLLIFALEEGGTRFPWGSGAIISTLVLAVVLGSAFAAWETYAERAPGPLEPVFPPSLARQRLLGFMLLTALFVGFPFVSVIVNIPQRAQAVYGLSPVNAGLTLLPLMLASPVATVLSAFLTGKAKIAPFYIILVACVLQVVGLGLTCSLPTETTSVPIAQYGYEVIMGFGFGLGLTTLLTFARAVVPEANLAVMLGAITQIRVLGGTISLAICATILNNHLSSRLREIVTSEEAALIEQSISAIGNLNATQQAGVREAFSEGYNQQNIFMTALGALALLMSCFLWERKPTIAS